MQKKSNKFKNNNFKKKDKPKDDLKGNELSGEKFTNFFKSNKLKKIVGLFLIILSFYLVLAFSSYLSSWKAEDDIFANKVFNWELVFDDTIEANNAMGRLGAITSHLFIKKWFGIPSYLFAFISFLLGVKVMFKKSLLPIWRTIRYSLFTIIWLSVTFGFLFRSNDLQMLGGTFGFEANSWLNGVFGNIGTGFILFFSITAFFISVLDVNFSTIYRLLKLPGKLFAKKDVQAEEETYEGDKEHTGSEEQRDIASESDLIQTIKERESEGNGSNKSAHEGIELELDEQNYEDTATKDEEQEKEEDDEESIDLEIEVSDGKVSNSNYQTIEEPYGENNEDGADLSHLENYDPTLDLPKYKNPPLKLLEDYGSDTIQVNKEELEANKNRIIDTLNNYSIQIDRIKATIGPTVTLYEIVPAAGIRISKIKNLEDDIALSLAALGIRIIAPIPGRGTIGIEVPNSKPETVSIKSILKSERFQNSSYELPIGLGRTIANETFIADLAKMPHLLIAGATGQGKSVGLNAILASILFKKHPAQVKFVLVDPKKVELTLFSKIERHFLAKLPDSEEAIINESSEIVRTLNSLCIEMNNRYDLLKDAKVRSVKEYNNKFVSRKLNPKEGHRYLPYIILIIDEFADLIMTSGKEVEMPIARLAQLSRAVGIHLIIATQRPSVNIITGTIKANFPARIAFKVTSKIDSRTILDASGADQLIGRGDMLLSTGSELLRLQCAFVDSPEIEKVTEFIGAQRGYTDAFHLPEYIDEESQNGEDLDNSEKDDMFDEAARLIVTTQQGSTSLLQRKLKLGYNRAGRIIDQLEAAGIVGPFEGSKAREVKIKDEMSLEQILRKE